MSSVCDNNYRCEQLFSMKVVESRTRIHLTDDHLEECMRIVTTEIKLDIDNYSSKNSVIAYISLMTEFVKEDSWEVCEPVGISRPNLGGCLMNCRGENSALLFMCILLYELRTNFSCDKSGPHSKVTVKRPGNFQFRWKYYPTTELLLISFLYRSTMIVVGLRFKWYILYTATLLAAYYKALWT
jgi:hypothetical protein